MTAQSQCDIQSMSTADLKAEFAEGLKISRDRILRLALVLAELERRGETVEGDKLMIKMLRRIAAGTLTVGAVVTFAARPKDMRLVSKLPLAEQDEAVRTGIVKKRQPQRDSTRPQAQNLYEAARKGTPQDVADMCAELLLNCQNPQMAVAHLRTRLSEIEHARKAS